jgi:signal transduction histidine kinase
LKTPLSVMMNEAAAHPDDPFATKVSEQIEIMRDQVAHHLERARLAAGMAAVIGTVTDVRSAVAALARTMEKIHLDRGITIDLDASDDAKFRGERQDLEEMLGNLVDNACKWAQSRVAIEVFSQQLGGADSPRVVRITVDDDGPGLSPSQREQVARRGRRLDETKPGSGLGLSIVVELAGLYGGELKLGTAPIGGLRAELVLPSA